MNRKEFGKLIAALREEHLEFSTRGMGVWTQTKLAKEANLAEKTIAQLEQGKKMNLDPQTLTQLARALKLTAGEQLELYTAAAGGGSVHRWSVLDGCLSSMARIFTGVARSGSVIAQAAVVGEQVADRPLIGP